MNDLPGRSDLPPGALPGDESDRERRRDDDDDEFWRAFWSEWPKPWNDDDV